jgi:hypothetical protein
VDDGYLLEEAAETERLGKASAQPKPHQNQPQQPLAPLEGISSRHLSKYCTAYRSKVVSIVKALCSEADEYAALVAQKETCFEKDLFHFQFWCHFRLWSEKQLVNRLVAATPQPVQFVLGHDKIDPDLLREYAPLVSEDFRDVRGCYGNLAQNELGDAAEYVGSSVNILERTNTHDREIQKLRKALEISRSDADPSAPDSPDTKPFAINHSNTTPSDNNFDTFETHYQHYSETFANRYSVETFPRLHESRSEPPDTVNISSANPSDMKILTTNFSSGNDIPGDDSSTTKGVKRRLPKHYTILRERG